MSAPSICTGNGHCDPRIPHVCYLGADVAERPWDAAPAVVRPLAEVLDEHVAQVNARRVLEAAVAAMDPDAFNHTHAADCGCASCQLDLLERGGVAR